MAEQHVSGIGSFTHNEVIAQRSERRVAAGARIGVVVARFNAPITDRLFVGAVEALAESGVDAGRIDAVQVPGAMEIPLAVQRLMASGCSAVVALGCIIRGDTAHFDYVCRAVTDGCLRVSLDTGKPVGFGVITCDTVEQALARAAELGSGGGHNVGADAAYAALELAIH